MSEFAFILLFFVLFMMILCIIYNNVVYVKRIKIKKAKNTRNKRIVFLADVLSNSHRSIINEIIESVQKCNPDIIIITGKADENNIAIVQYTIEKLAQISTVFCTADLPFNSECIRLCDNEAKIYSDYSVMCLSKNHGVGDVLENFSRLENTKILVCDNSAALTLAESADNITLVLCHRSTPAFRMPFYGIIYSSTEGFFPKYPNRSYTVNNNALAITTGAGRTSLYVRMSIFREILCVDFE